MTIGASSGHGSNGGEASRGRSDHARAATPAPAEPEKCATAICRGNYAVVTVPDVTLADLASFTPARPALTGEPRGVGVVGLPTNLVASASEQRMSGRILDFDVTVRFVPAGFVFDYGDGSTRRSSTAGVSWSRAGQASFTPTATSHVYTKPGTYPVRVTVLYAPSVDFGSGVWRPVDGYVRATSGGYDVRVVEVRTALVDRTCLENPSGPGC
ncbi:MAG: hypothetical protein J0I50_03400 [Microbacterium sp.]|nr:hypothetical protein [Microbacterium sp.]